MTITVRKAKPGDEPVILNFITELATYEKLAHEVVATMDHIRKTLFTEYPKAFALIAEIDDAPVGFAVYFFNYSTFLGRHGLYLEDLFVPKDQRGLGVGKALLSHLAQIAVAQDCGRMEWSVLDWNAPAIEFYKSLGAQAMEGWTINRLTGEALSALAGEGAS
ncbi:MAG: GNAT family N-acetyltransferase [Pseudomonadota bacterium]